MFPSFRSALAPALTALGLLLAPAPGLGESRFVTGSESTGSGAGASLNLRIVIPAVMRVMENSHPLQLEARADGAMSAEQRLVVLSNMKRGFCVSLRLAAPGVDHWELRTPSDNNVSLSPAGDGYRLCSTRPGRYTLVLRHEFGVSAPGHQAMHWPVQTDISAI
ncbi:MAG: hypothetical protein U5N10_18815 [Gemmobacter sp.]|nr:hypothetical protein [Gemmobacter sp.]